MSSRKKLGGPKLQSINCLPPSEGRGTPYNDLYGEAAPAQMGYFFHGLKYLKGQGNLSFQSLKCHKRPTDVSCNGCKKDMKTLPGLFLFLICK